MTFDPNLQLKYRASDMLRGCGVMKFTKTCKTPQNLLDKTSYQYMLAQHIWNLSCLLGLLTCCKLVNLWWDCHCNIQIKHKKTTCILRSMLQNTDSGLNVKALPLAHFLSALLLKEQMKISPFPLAKTAKLLSFFIKKSAKQINFWQNFPRNFTWKFWPLIFRHRFSAKFAPRFWWISHIHVIGCFSANLFSKIWLSLQPIRSPESLEWVLHNVQRNWQVS